MIQIGIIIVLTVFVLIKLFSFKLAKDDLTKSTAELRAEFQRKDFLLLFLFLILLPSFTVGFAYLFNWLANWSISDDKSVIYIIKPGMEFWFVMAMMSSLAYALYSTLKITKWIFKADERNYWIYYSRKYPYDATARLKYLGIILVLCSSILVCLNLNSYVKFKDTKIEINQFDSLKQKTYGLETITKIIHYKMAITPEGNTIQPHYGVIFNDNFEWRTNDNRRTPDINDDKIFSFLSAKTGLEIEEMENDQ
jgi:hypothetical protein